MNLEIDIFAALKNAEPRVSGDEPMENTKKLPVRVRTPRKRG